jgi:hypothetical protein
MMASGEIRLSGTTTRQMPVLAQSQSCSGCGTVWSDPNNATAGVTVTASAATAPAFFLGDSTMFFAPSGTQFQSIWQAGRNFALQGGKYSQIGQFIGRRGTLNPQLISAAQGLGYDFYQAAANFEVGVFSNGFFNGSSLGYAEMISVGEAYGAGLVNGQPSTNWSPSMVVQWGQWWTAGWNAAQSGNYPVQVGTPLQLSYPLQ